MSKQRKIDNDILEYQPDAVEIEDRPVPGKVRWVLYIIICSLVFVVIGAIVFKVDRVVVAQGKLITTSPTIVVQPLATSIVRSIDVEVGDVINKDQILATLDSTFASADLGRLTAQKNSLAVQIRRIEAELKKISFNSNKEEGADGILQEQLFRQRNIILEKNRSTIKDRIAVLEAKITLNTVQCEGQEQQIKILRDIEGQTALLPQKDENYRIRLLETQKARILASNQYENLKAEKAVFVNELKQVKSEWHGFLEERTGKLLEEEVQLRADLENILEEINKAERMHDLVELRAPEKAIVLNLAKRSVGSVVQQAEPFITLVPYDSIIEAEIDISSKDIGRVRVGDYARIKIDAFPFQRHDTLPGEVRVISEDSSQQQQASDSSMKAVNGMTILGGVYKSRVSLLSTTLRNVPDGFRLMPGMKLRVEIKVGQRRIISYFLYPIIRILDESMREP